MQIELKTIIGRYKENENLLNRILVSLFVKSNCVKVNKNVLVKNLILPEPALNKHVGSTNLKLGFDDLIEAFELAIPQKDKVKNGAVYTPTFIKTFIVENSFRKVKKKNYQSILAADISCGCGAFLYTVANKIKEETTKSYYQIYKENVWGLDISKSSITRSEILLTLLALYKGEDKAKFEFNLFCGNALSFNWFSTAPRVKANNGFDLIIGNPPYVRAKNIDKPSKDLLAKWAVTKSGNPDLYIPFFEIGLSLLNNKGALGYITANSFYKSVNARELRRLFQNLEYELSIIDFGHEKIFGKLSVYTSICIVSKSYSPSILFKKESSETLVRNGTKLFNRIPYKDLDYKRGWLLSDTKVIENIKRIESQAGTLGDLYKIKNGIATLSNDTYIFKPVRETKEYFILVRNGQQYEIEKGICRDIIKPNILKFENEIEAVKEKLIFPYSNGSKPLTLMSEKHLRTSFPKAYKYLLDNKKLLSERDKGEGEYEAWYAFGRTQALTDYGLKLVFPYMAKKPHFVLAPQKDMLIYCGYAIFNESPEELKILKRILESKVFEYYMEKTSKPYSAGYFSYAKNYVKNFGICKLNEKERYFLSNGASKKEVDDFLIDKYEISI